MEINIKIAVIGLGYVGLPLARLFSTKYPTVGFDLKKSRIDELMGGHDSTNEVSDELLKEAIKNGLVCSNDLNSIKEILGHSSLAATQVYTHNSFEQLKKTYLTAHPRAINGGKNGN